MLGISGFLGVLAFSERDLFRALISLRKNCDVLVYGSYETLYAGDGGIYVFARRYQESTVTVALNARGSRGGPNCALPSAVPALSDGYHAGTLDSFGYAVWIE